MYQLIDWIVQGDMVSRGNFSVETLQLLLAYKVKWSDQVTILRGNQECKQLSQVYGFYDECLRKYGNVNVWRQCCTIFNYLPLSAVIDNAIVCMHGGLSYELPTIDSIRLIDRFHDLRAEGPVTGESFIIHRSLRPFHFILLFFSLFVCNRSPQ
jgi:hypothetical protein